MKVAGFHFLLYTTAAFTFLYYAKAAVRVSAHRMTIGDLHFVAQSRWSELPVNSDG